MTTTGAGVTAPRVVVAGGHSAGHIEPAMNFADALRRLEPTAEITALGTVRGLDTTLIPARGYPLELIPPVPLPRKLNRALLHTPDRLRDSVLAAAALRATGVQVLHITGPQNVVEVPDGDPADPPYVVIPYVDEMQYAYAAAGAPDADVVLARHVLTCAVA
jgi:UDP-N-acetylglucosamine:LPS N-acetylglucosamine transferase